MNRIAVIVSSHPGIQDLDELLVNLRALPASIPYSDELVNFCAGFSRALAKAARGNAELQALAFWMRKAELDRLQRQFRALADEHTVLVPRGVVFHVPPANVDTIFIYSWLLSVLAGNRNIVRMSSRQSSTTKLIQEVLNVHLAGQVNPALRNGTVLVTYGHEEEITDAISGIADVRVIWGGDATVDRIRRSPLMPHAVELTFPDRFSMAAMKSEAYAAIDSSGRDLLAEKFYNDVYWFDQMGCSSPRILSWVGDDTPDLRIDFAKRLMAVVRRKRYQVDTSIAMRKMVFAHGAVINHGVKHIDWESNELVLLSMDELTDVRGEFCGGGLIFTLTLDSLTDLVPHLERRDQTLTQFGFTADELRALALAANGRGLDRIVPVGEALTFNRIWDGNDLLQSFARRIWISADGSGL